MYALGIISVPFFLVGLYLIARYIQFKTKGEKIYGKVIAYEKYYSRSGRNRNSKQLLYAPIIKFQYRSKVKYLKEAGSNMLLHYLGKKIELRVLNKNINHIKSMTFFSLLFGVVFLKVGTILIYLHMRKFSHDSIEFFIPIILVILVPVLIYSYLNKKGYVKEIIKAHYDNQSVFDSFDSKKFLSSQQELDRETKKHKSSGLIISIIFSIITFWAGAAIWNKIPKKNQDILMNPQMWEHIKIDSKEPMELIFLFIVFLGVFMTISIVKQIRS